MRIALVAEDYYPQLGGVPEHVHHLARELNARGEHATIVTSHMRHAGPDPEFVTRVGTSLVLYANGGVARITVAPRLRARLTALFRTGRYDVVHVHGGLNPVLGLVAPLAARRAGIPVVATFHTWFPRSIGYRVFRRPLQRMLDRHAATVAVGPAAVEAMSRYFRADWEIIPNGVDTDAFAPDGRAAPAGPPRSPQLLFLGRLEPRTGLGTLLDAFPAILAHFPEARLLVAGEGPWRRAYQRRATAFGSRVRFLGSVFHERPSLYQSADLYLCPTTRASFGVTLLEAMACGTPMVVADLPAFRHVATPAAARFAPAADPAAWADAAVALLRDAPARRALAAAGRARALDHAWPRITDRLLAVYARVVGAGHGGGVPLARGAGSDSPSAARAAAGRRSPAARA
jgi:phosphatidylinositol alpha-mannosyltransferase